MKIKKMFTIIAMLLVVIVAGCKKDEDPGKSSTVTSTSPSNNATGVVLNKTVTVLFSTPMDPSTITVQNFTIKTGSTSVTGAVSYADSTASFTPSSEFLPDSVYTATIKTGAKNMSGMQMSHDYVWKFTTGTRSSVTSVNPVNNATGVVLTKVVTVNFSVAIDPLTLTATSFTLKHGASAVDGTISYNGTTATFTPSSELLPSTIYTGTVTTGVKNAQGIALANNYVWNFTSGALPTVSSTDPANNAISVGYNKVVTATFSVPMDPLTLSGTTFTVKHGVTSVAGTVSYTGSTASFTPSSALTPSTVYTGTITTGAKNVPGIPLANNFVWSFTTSGQTSGLAAVNLGAAGNYVILAKSAISNISISAITGDLGLSPAATSYVTGLSITNATGFATSAQVTGKLYAADMADPTPINLTTAVNNMITAYDDAAGRPTPDFLELGTGNIGGKTLTPGLYKWTTTVSLPSNVTISGSSTDVWIFQIAGDLTMSSAVNVTLIGGALPKNIFWQVSGQATFGANSHFEGIILSKTGITFQTSASFNGRALAQTAVTLDGNAITKP